MFLIKRMGNEDEYHSNDDVILVRTMYRKFDVKTKKTLRLFKKEELKSVKDLTKDDYIGEKINDESKLFPWYGTLAQHGANAIRLKKDIVIDNPKFWYYIGRVVADGCAVTYKRGKRNNSYVYQVQLCCGHHEYDDLIKIMDNCGFTYRKSKERTVYKFIVTLQELYEFVSLFGKYAHNKFVPKFVQDLPKNLLKQFVDGYLSGDGYIDSSGNHTATSVSRELIFTMKECIKKVYEQPVKYYFTKRKTKCTIEGRVVNQRDSHTLRFKTDIRKQDKAFVSDGYVWYPIKSINEVDDLDFTSHVCHKVNGGVHEYNTISELIRHEFDYFIHLVKLNEIFKIQKTLIGKAKLTPIYDTITIRDLASKCKSRVEFSSKHRTAYTLARKSGILDDVCKHMVNQRKPVTMEIAIKLANECSSRTDLSNKHGGVYNWARKNNKLDILFPENKN